MKLPCKVRDKAALIVGYAQSKRSKVMAIVICEGELRAFRLKDIELVGVPECLQKKENVVQMAERKAGS